MSVVVIDAPARLRPAPPPRVQVAPTCTRTQVAPGVFVDVHKLEDEPINELSIEKNGKRLWLTPGEAIAVARGVFGGMVEREGRHAVCEGGGE